jgi:hypothetical protein
MRDQRRQQIIIAVLGVVLLAVVLKFWVFDGDGDGTGSATTRSSGDVTVPIGTTTTVDGIPDTPNTFDVQDSRDPFEPAIQVTPTTPTTGPTNTTTSTTGTTVPGQTTTSTTMTPTNDPNQTITLLSITRQSNGTFVAVVRVGGTVYDDVLEGETFGPSNSYRFVRARDDRCGDFQHGDTTFQLCENQSTNK